MGWFEEDAIKGREESAAAGGDAYARIYNQSKQAPQNFNFDGGANQVTSGVRQVNQNLSSQANAMGQNALGARQAAYQGGQNTALAGGVAKQLGYQGDMQRVGLQSTVLGEQLQGMREQQLGLNRRDIASLGQPLAEETGNIAGEGAARADAWGSVLGLFGSDPKLKKEMYQLGVNDAMNKIVGAQQTPREQSRYSQLLPSRIQFSPRISPDAMIVQDEMERDYLQRLEDERVDKYRK